MKKLLIIILTFTFVVFLSGCIPGIDDEDPVEYNITFESNGGTEVNSIKVEDGKSFLEPSNPSKEGYIFTGWYSDSLLNNFYIFTSPVLSNLVLYAGWEAQNAGDESRSLTIYIAPIRDAAEILGATEPLKQLLIDELAELGYNFDKIIIEVGSSYEAVGEALISGTADVGLLPGSTYASFPVNGEIEIILSAIRTGLNKDFSDAIDWNDGLATIRDEAIQVPFYRGLIVAGPSTYGRVLADKVNAGTTLTWDDFNDANWCVRGSTSSSGFKYPSVWLMDQFNGKGIPDLNSVAEMNGYGDLIAGLADETCDIATIYTDARIDYDDTWIDDTEGFGRTSTIWEEIDVIGVTNRIYNDTISVSNVTVDSNLADAIATAFVNITKTAAGQEIIGIFGYNGYMPAASTDYDNERAMQVSLANTYEIAMITDSGGIDDESYNQETWESIVEFAEENNLSYKYYIPSDVSTDSYLTSIALAVEGGAKIIVTPGFLFETSIYVAQDLYPDIHFILIDGEPHDANWTTWNTADNTLSIMFDEHESGFLAGYATVMDGYTELGFTGGMPVPAVIEFGIGYIAGAYYAAAELGVDITFNDDTYYYFGEFVPSDDFKNIASSWYINGTEVIFSAAGWANASVISAAEDNNTMMIGVDIDQANHSSTVLTSALKQVGNAVQQGLQAWLDNDFDGGSTIYLGAANDGVALPMDNSRFTSFTQTDYDAIYLLLANETIAVPKTYDELLTFLDDDTLDIPSQLVVEGGDIYEIAMITDSGRVDDESFNQGTWEGIVEFAEDNNLTYKYYIPSDVSADSYLDAISLAIANGAKVVITPGYLFETSIYIAQDLYPEIYFILIDGVPNDGDWENGADFKTADNTLPILFNEHESGFLAGYAAVMDGYRNLGFTGGVAVPAVVEFGIGYIAGAYYAADVLDVEITFNDDTYHYFGDFSPSDDHKNLVSAWYLAGTEIVFSASGGAGASVMAAAADNDAMMIGVDIDQAGQSDTVLTSALKQIGNAVQKGLEDWLNDEFNGGTTIYLGAANDGVALPMDTSRFTTFTQADYDAIYALLKNGTIIVPATYDELLTFLDDNTLDIPSQLVVEDGDIYEIAMINDLISGITGGSYNEETWEGIVEFAEENNLTYKEYIPLEASADSYLDAIALAVAGGAKIIVTPGFRFETSIYIAQDLYPEIYFILIDGMPNDADWQNGADFHTANNTLSIMFDEHESGFLAGYAAVMDGYRNLGFIGGMAVPAVVEFGIGYIAGAYYAADILDVEITFNSDTYHYLGDFNPSDNHKNLASSWYVAGTEVIFSAAGGANASVMIAAENNNTMIIGVDIDQSDQSSTVLTSAMKQVGNAVQQGLQAWLNDNFNGGTTIYLGAANDGVALPMDTSRFTSFTQAHYDAIYALLENGTIVVPATYSELLTFLDDHTLDIPSQSVVEGD